MAPLTDVDPSALPISLASCSIGLPRHTLAQKLDAIARAGFQGIELSFPDLLAHARDLKIHGQLLPEQHEGDDGDDGDVAEDDWPALCAAAAHARRLCAARGLAILVLQPFAHLEGWTDPGARAAALARARGWARIMRAAGTDTLQVGATDVPARHLAADPRALAADLAALADLLASNWCWATRAPRWRDAWEVARLAGRDAVGLCLDTFQSAGGEWGDPTTASGLVERRPGGAGEDGEAAVVTGAALADAWRASLRDLAREVLADKIFFLQISDAYRMVPPLAPRPEPDDETGLRPRGRWSHDYRPLPYDGGYLPIADFLRAVLETGFRGWLSVEVFDGQFENKYGDDLMGFAQKARSSTRKLVEEAAAMETL